MIVLRSFVRFYSHTSITSLLLHVICRSPRRMTICGPSLTATVARFGAQTCLCMCLCRRDSRSGAQELEIVLGQEHISFTTAKIGSLVDVNDSKYAIVRRLIACFVCNQLFVCVRVQP